MNKYEISLWEDYPTIVTAASGNKVILKERKIAVIGSDTMEAQARALEPNLVQEINGSNTFTFKMYYTYTDNQTGEKYQNPFGKYLINERKVKVLWENKWYDFVIKKCQEDSSKKMVTYTCNDLFINELSKQGYNLEFDIELQNNIGTAAELAKQVLEESTWLYDDEASTPIIQKTEGPVYEVQTITEFIATKQIPNGDIDTIIPFGKNILVFYDSLVNVLAAEEKIETTIQFLYDPNKYITDINDMVVINGDCYCVTLSFVKDGNKLIGLSIDNDEPVISINLEDGVSNKYTAKRLVKSQKTEYDPLLDRYVLICTDSQNHKVYEIATTQYNDPLIVINLIANPNNFINTAGWMGNVEKFGIFPKFGPDTEIATYEAKAYLKLSQGWVYNSAIQSNISYFTPNDTEKQQGKFGGIQKGEKFIYRIKAYEDNQDSVGGSQINTNGVITPNIYSYGVTSYEPSGNPILNCIDVTFINGWLEYTFEANQSISANKLNEYGLFVRINRTLWIEDAQFFKYLEGATSYDKNAEIRRIDPGNLDLQSIVVPVYKYYYPNSTATDAKDLVYVYCGETESSDYAPVYNNYEKIGTISESGSNRFNILQSIAEAFQCWVRFRIDHEDDGSIKIINGIQQKYVYFVEDIEHDNGLCFEYGIDLKAVTRSIDSDKLATKIIVNPNNNEFGKDGFCTISRSNENYSKENFILNLDYFTQQNLLDENELKKDLYGINSKLNYDLEFGIQDDEYFVTNDNNTFDVNNNLYYIGYYYYLHQYNSEYDKLAEQLRIKNLDLVKQTSQMKVYEQYLSAAQQQLDSVESDLINLAGVEQWLDVQAYARNNAENEKVQSLLNTHAKIQNQIFEYSTSYDNISRSLVTLQGLIDSYTERQKELVVLIKAKHKEFNDKYSNYLIEGTWQDENYTDDTKYYLDALKVAYTSSRPQLSYNINVLRLNQIEEYSSKKFNLGDICYIQDREFFGYLVDGITPYKEKILISKISSFFDQPERDVITVQNYKTRFDDLFQRIAATSQNLEYAEGAYQRAANSINTDGTIDSTILQNTFDQNQDFVLNSSNQDVIWDDTGITVTDKFNSGNKTKILAGGIFITNDGGRNWRNAIRGDGISASLLTAGRINTNEIYIYDGNAPTFRWDSYGLTAYSREDGAVNFGQFVRFDKYGLYGYNGNQDFVPTSLNDITNNAAFSLTWEGLTINDDDAVISTGGVLIDAAGITMTGGRLFLGNEEGDTYFYAKRLDTNVQVNFGVGSGGSNHGVYSIGYNDGNTFHTDKKWMIYRNSAGNVIVNGTAINNLPLGEVLSEIPNNSNINDYYLPGAYKVVNNSSAATMTNLPIANGGVLYVRASAGQAISASSTWKYLVQEFLTFAGYLYIRKGDSGSGTTVTWGNWYRYLTTASLPLSISNVGCVTEVVTMSQLSLPASGTAHDSKDVSKTGYTPVGIVGITGSNTTGCNIMEFYLSGTTAYIWANNNTATAKTPTYKLTILYFKS